MQSPIKATEDSQQLGFQVCRPPNQQLVLSTATFCKRKCLFLFILSACRTNLEYTTYVYTSLVTSSLTIMFGILVISLCGTVFFLLILGFVCWVFWFVCLFLFLSILNIASCYCISLAICINYYREKKTCACVIYTPRPRPPQVFFSAVSGARITTSTNVYLEIALLVATRWDYVAKWRKTTIVPAPLPRNLAQSSTSPSRYRCNSRSAVYIVHLLCKLYVVPSSSWRRYPDNSRTGLPCFPWS